MSQGVYTKQQVEGQKKASPDRSDKESGGLQEWEKEREQASAYSGGWKAEYEVT